MVVSSAIGLIALLDFVSDNKRYGRSSSISEVIVRKNQNLGHRTKDLVKIFERGLEVDCHTSILVEVKGYNSGAMMFRGSWCLWKSLEVETLCG